jgi:hypothetical protein
MTDFVDLLEEQLVNAHGWRRRRRLPSPRAGLTVVIGAAAAAAVVAIVLALASPTARPPAGRPAAPAAPAATRVAVLNATRVNGLARTAADRLSAAGYRIGVVTDDAVTNTLGRSAVLYAPGRRTAAAAVAARLGIARVAPLDAGTAGTVAGAGVVVRIGIDRAP